MTDGFALKISLTVAVLISSLATSARSLAATEMEAREFYTGLWAAPGSSERKRTGELFQSWLNRAAKDGAALVKTKENKREYEITKNVLQMTADYLKADQTCSAEQKIRLYRGSGKFGVIFQNGKPLAPWSSWNYQYVMRGQPIPAEQREKNRTDPFADLDFKILEEQTCANCTKDFKWSEIVTSHSGTGSGTSPLLSTSLEWSVAKKFAHPHLLVMDVCPERGMAVFYAWDGMATFPEAEVYLPLFALPEEIVAIVNVPDADPFFKPETKLTTQLNAVTRGMRRTFFSKDLPFDVQYLTKIAPMIPLTDAGIPSHTAYVENFKPDRLYDVIVNRYASGLDIKSWRQRAVDTIITTPTTQTTCKYAFNTYIKSEVYRSGIKPVRKFTFPNGKVDNATFERAEHAKVHEVFRKWRTGFSEEMTNADPHIVEYTKGFNLFQAYFDQFERFHLVAEKLYVGYLAKCEGD